MIIVECPVCNESTDVSIADDCIVICNKCGYLDSTTNVEEWLVDVKQEMSK